MAGKLIGFLFLTIGIGGFVYAGKVMIDTRSAKNWVPHTAQIDSAGLETHVNDKGHKSYSIIVTYKFDWEGTSFSGRHYRLHDKATLNFEENDKVVKALLRSKRDDGCYPIFVNPKNPRQSAVLNQINPKAKKSGLFLGFVFSLIGYLTAFEPKLFRKRGSRNETSV